MRINSIREMFDGERSEGGSFERRRGEKFANRGGNAAAGGNLTSRHHQSRGHLYSGETTRDTRAKITVPFRGEAIKRIVLPRIILALASSSRGIRSPNTKGLQ